MSKPAVRIPKESYTFWVPGRPVAWARARTSGGRYFTAPEQADDQAAIRAAYSSDRARPGMNSTKAWGLLVGVFLTPPASWTKLRRLNALSGWVRPTGTPDWDNFGKQVSDALAGLCWANDSQIVDGGVTKHYSATACRCITIWEVGTVLQGRSREAVALHEERW